MSGKGLQQSRSGLDNYLMQVAPILQTCRNAVYEITQKKLLFHNTRLELEYVTSSFDMIPFVVEEHEKSLACDPSCNVIKTDKEALYLMEFLKVYCGKLTRVVVKVLDVEKNLQNKDSTLSRKVNKLTAFKNGLDEFTRVLDKMYAFYSAKLTDFLPAVHLPSLEDVKKMKEKFNSIKRKLEKDELSALFAEYDSDFYTSTEIIFCTILGLTEWFGDRLFRLGTDARNHQSVMYYLEKWIESKESKMEEDEIQCQSGKQGLVENMQKLGFNQHTSIVISNSIPADFIDLHNPSFWALRYLDYAYNHHPLLSKRSRYPHNKNVLDEWFEVNLPLDNPLELSVPQDALLSSVRMINISSGKGQGDTLVENFLIEQSKDTDYKLLYHGTTHERAISVVTEGIFSDACTKQDFSRGLGFYLLFEFEQAKAWGKAGRGDHHAVIVYKVNCSLLDTVEKHGLDLTQDKSLWEKVVRSFRYGTGRCKNIFEDYAFIQGPMCKNSKYVRKNEPLQCFEETAVQFCIRSRRYAKEFESQNNIACIIFY